MSREAWSVYWPSSCTSLSSIIGLEPVSSSSRGPLLREARPWFAGGLPVVVDGEERAMARIVKAVVIKKEDVKEGRSTQILCIKWFQYQEIPELSSSSSSASLFSDNSASSSSDSAPSWSTSSGLFCYCNHPIKIIVTVFLSCERKKVYMNFV